MRHGRVLLKSVGVDSCKKVGGHEGWMAFWLEAEGRWGFEVYRTVAEVVAEHEDAGCVLIDIPIGLAESKGEVRPDGELRKRLKGKSSSVFNTPCRQAVHAGEKNEARRLNREILGIDLSQQSIGFSRKIKEVDDFLQANARYVGRIRESHPEYAFAVMNGGAPVLARKVEAAGQEARLAIVEKWFAGARTAMAEFGKRGFSSEICDDFIDAMALAVVGMMGIRNGFETLPEAPPRDSRGLPMEIVYCKACCAL